MESNELKTVTDKRVPLPVAVSVASFAAPLGAIACLSVATGRWPHGVTDWLDTLKLFYLFILPVALPAALLVAWPVMAALRYVRCTAWITVLPASVLIGAATGVLPAIYFIGEHMSPKEFRNFGVVAGVSGLFAGVLLCAILRLPLRIRRENA
jgi:hypothetical protein